MTTNQTKVLKYQLTPIQSERPEEKSNDADPVWDQVIQSLPAAIRAKAKKLTSLVGNKIQIIPDTFQVVYKDGVVGSSVVSLMTYALSNAKSGSPQPWDGETFVKYLMADLKVPVGMLSKKAKAESGVWKNLFQ